MQITKNGLKIIKNFEGLKLKPYPCSSNIPTIGYGSTYYENGKKVTLQDAPITKVRAEQLLTYITDKDFASIVNKYVRVPLTQNQFDALVSLAYNIGGSRFRKSTLVKKLNKYDYVGAANSFWMWRKSGRKILKGLVRRRKMEKELFLKDM